MSGDGHMKLGGNTKLRLSSLRGRELFDFKKERMKRMGRLIAKKLNELEWGLAGCLLFLGISSPAFHQFYRK